MTNWFRRRPIARLIVKPGPILETEDVVRIARLKGALGKRERRLGNANRFRNRLLARSISSLSLRMFHSFRRPSSHYQPSLNWLTMLRATLPPQWKRLAFVSINIGTNEETGAAARPPADRVYRRAPPGVFHGEDENEFSRGKNIAQRTAPALG